MTADIKETIANEAIRIVTGARRAVYGRPEQNFERIARLQAAYLASRAEPDAPVSPLDVPFLNLMQKVARICESPTHLDSYVDGLGYIMCAAEIAGVDGSALEKTEAPRPSKFKIGDLVRVVCNADAPRDYEVGERGVIDAIEYDTDGTGVLFGFKGDMGARMFAGRFELVEPEQPTTLKPGDTVRVLEGAAGTAEHYVGEEVRVTSIRGEHVYFFADKDSREHHALLVSGEWERVA